MHALLDQFELAAKQQAQRLNEGGSYLDTHSDSGDVYLEINREEEELRAMRGEMAGRARMLSQLRQKQSTFIFDHPQYRTKALQQLLFPPTASEAQEEECQLSFQKHVRPNHQITIQVRICQIFPVLHKWGNLQDQLSFDSLRFHLHHIDKASSSPTMRYHPRHNMYHCSQLVNGKMMMRSNKQITLSIRHQVRADNQIIYLEMFGSQAIVIVAESSYGSVLGFAELDKGIFLEAGEKSRTRNVTLAFKAKRSQQDGCRLSSPAVFTANTTISVSCAQIAPEVEQLAGNVELATKYRPNSRSPSPNKVISKSPVKRTHSAKGKRRLLESVVRGVEGTVKLTVYDGRQYKLQVDNLNPTLSRELVYKKVVNVRDKKVDLIKIENKFYLKMLVTRDSASKHASIHFGFNNLDFYVKIVKNTIYEIFQFPDYQQMFKSCSKQDWQQMQNKVVHLGGGLHIYIREDNRLFRSLAIQQLQDALLATVYIKSHSTSPGAAIYCNKPFSIYEIVRKDDGYFITYFYHAQPLSHQLQTLLVFYICDQANRLNQIHIFECVVRNRAVERQSVVREVFVGKEEQFVRLSMKMITSESYQYQVKAADDDRVAVVNGQNFKYQNKVNQSLILQMINPLTDRFQTDLIFYDDKARSFFLRLSLRPTFAPSP